MKIFKRLSQVWYRLSRPMTLGVRVLAIDGDNRVCLVRHSYAPGWHLPGGGVERDETCLAAAIKEAREEAGLLVAPDDMTLKSIHANFALFKGDHVVVYQARQWASIDINPAFEIAETGFFPLSSLPEGTTSGTRRRIHESQGGQVDLFW